MAAYDEVRRAMIAALAVTHGLECDEIEALLLRAGGDYVHELDSKAAEFLLVAAEAVAGCRLPCPADLGRTQYATLGVLIDVVLKETT